MVKKVVGFVVGVLVTYLVAVPLVSQFNILSITQLGYPVSIGDRVNTALHDIVGMVQIYLPVIVIGLLIAWLFTGLLLTRLIPRSAFLYCLAGFTGLVAIHIILYMVFGVNGVAATRNVFGLLSQGLAGAVGGWVFYRLAFDAGGADRVRPE